MYVIRTKIHGDFCFSVVHADADTRIKSAITSRSLTPYMALGLPNTSNKLLSKHDAQATRLSAQHRTTCITTRFSSCNTSSIDISTQHEHDAHVSVCTALIEHNRQPIQAQSTDTSSQHHFGKEQLIASTRYLTSSHHSPSKQPVQEMLAQTAALADRCHITARCQCKFIAHLCVTCSPLPQYMLSCSAPAAKQTRA